MGKKLEKGKWGCRKIPPPGGGKVTEPYESEDISIWGGAV